MYILLARIDDETIELVVFVLLPGVRLSSTDFAGFAPHFNRRVEWEMKPSFFMKLLKISCISNVREF